ncbi:MAG TPA: transcription termination/antitermination NusG family protein [Candidatus Angelobacter sp.]|nr:transcription termination/antitermination NusG family protein [Candidatus Angelobacter sp.]
MNCTVIPRDFESESKYFEGKGWFAVFTTPRHEKRIKEHFCLRQIENFLPLYRTPRQWKDGSKGTLELPLFPRYIFARIGAGSRIPVLEVPGVISIVGSSRESLSIPDSYVHLLRDGLRLGKVEPHPYLAEGAKVRVRSGLMAGMEGILLWNKNNFRVVLTIEMIMKSIVVEVDRYDIEAIDPHAGAYIERAAG